MTRDLGGGERSYWIVNQWSPNNALAIAELDGLLEPTQLVAALAALQWAHPSLGFCVVADSDGRNPRFVPRRDAAIPIETVDARDSGLSPARLDALITDELNHPVDASDTLVRLTYIHDAERSALILNCLHVIADGISVMYALRDLLRAYESAQGVLETHPCRPAYEALMPPEQRGLRSLPTVLRTQGAAIVELLRRKPHRLPKQVDVPMHLRRNAYLRRALPPVEVEKLRRACKAHSVTVHGVLTAALGLAVADELGLRSEPHATLNVGSPYSVRSELRPEITDDLGPYVSMLNVFLDVGGSQSLWSVARQVNDDLQRRRERDEPFAVMNLVGWIAPRSHKTSKWVVDLADSQGPGNLCVSNMGVFDMPSEVSGIAVRSAHVCGSLSVTGYFMCAVCTTARGLQLDFVYIDQIVSQQRARRLVDGMLGKLAAALPATVVSRHADRLLS